MLKFGYETAAAVLKVNEAAQAGRKADFEHEEFEVQQLTPSDAGG